MGQASEPTDGDLARDVCEKFGLLYAGGCLAIRYGLLPWKKSEVRDALLKYYLPARELLPDEGQHLREVWRRCHQA